MGTAKREKPISLARAIWATVHEARLSVEEIAEQLGYSRWNLYKMVEPEESDRNFPATKLPALMKITGDYRALDYLAGVCGYAVTKLPAARKRAAKDLGDLAALYGQVSQILHRAYERGEISQDGLSRIDELLRDLVGHRRAAQEIHDRQESFDFDQQKTEKPRRAAGSR